MATAGARPEGGVVLWNVSEKLALSDNGQKEQLMAKLGSGQYGIYVKTKSNGIESLVWDSTAVEQGITGDTYVYAVDEKGEEEEEEEDFLSMHSSTDSPGSPASPVCCMETRLPFVAPPPDLAPRFNDHDYVYISNVEKVARPVPKRRVLVMKPRRLLLCCLDGEIRRFVSVLSIREVFQSKPETSFFRKEEHVDVLLCMPEDPPDIHLRFHNRGDQAFKRTFEAVMAANNATFTWEVKPEGVASYGTLSRKSSQSFFTRSSSVFSSTPAKRDRCQTLPPQATVTPVTRDGVRHVACTMSPEVEVPLLLSPPSKHEEEVANLRKEIEELKELQKEATPKVDASTSCAQEMTTSWTQVDNTTSSTQVDLYELAMQPEPLRALLPKLPELIDASTQAIAIDKELERVREELDVTQHELEEMEAELSLAKDQYYRIRQTTDSSTRECMEREAASRRRHDAEIRHIKEAHESVLAQQNTALGNYEAAIVHKDRMIEALQREVGELKKGKTGGASAGVVEPARGNANWVFDL